MRDIDITQFWGKTDKRPGISSYHPAICHMADVGAVAEAMITFALAPRVITSFASSLGIAEARAAAWAGFLVALHDLGKISPGFQAKIRPLCPQSNPDRVPSSSACTNHAEITYHALKAVFEQHLDRKGPSRIQAVELALALSGHHGIFPGGSIDPLASEEGWWKEARQVCVENLRRLFQVEWAELNPPPQRFPSAWLMILAGMTSVADWLGSDQEMFPLAGGTIGDLSVYVDRTRDRAREALRRCGWHALPRVNRPCGFANLFPKVPGTPNEMQKTCERLARVAQEPFMLLVEVPMGQGKTEAALWTAEIARQSMGLNGLYYALPTQATTNQMFLRVRDFLSDLFPGQNVEFHLLHSLADLNEAFQELRTSTPSYEPQPRDVEGTESSVQAHEWFRAQKRGLLAPFAVGTVDQALLSVLTTRHMFVRLFGLAHKTVVIDEVHAYDAYMSTLLDRLIKWLAALGSNVILLSATLPKKRRQELLKAYAGRNCSDTDIHYPCVHFATASDLKAEYVPQTEGITIQVQPCGGSFSKAMDLLAERLQDGGCAVWICNTVNHAQKAFHALENDSRFEDIGEENRILFHARFLVKDRLRIEAEVLRKFGKPAYGKEDQRPRKAIVVATQVIEQSLDLDFDLMLTELPPVDLLLQRMGRLHRHRLRDAGRPWRLKTPTIFWLEPERDAERRPQFGPSGCVYQPYILLQTWRLLQQRNHLRLPGDVEEWIETVYADRDETEDFAREWKAQMQKERITDQSAARKWIVPPPDLDDGVLDKLRHDLVLSDDEENSQRLTRLDKPTVIVVCLHVTPAGLSFTPDGSEPFDPTRKPDREAVGRLLAHSVRMEAWRWKHYENVQPTPDLWNDVALLRNCKLARLREGMLKHNGRILTLDERTGLKEDKL